jgi:prepilin-type N-terminal cleavage/methylation domain-containing protein
MRSGNTPLAMAGQCTTLFQPFAFLDASQRHTNPKRQRGRPECSDIASSPALRVGMKTSDMSTTLQRKPIARRGYTLLELIAVLGIIGILAGMAVVRLSPDSVANFGSRVDARQVALDLMQARRRAIATGDNHLLVFTQQGTALVGYAVHRRNADDSTAAVDDYHTFPDKLTVTASSLTPEFTFEGESLTAYTITLTGPDRSWQVTVTQAAGMVEVAEQ